MRILVTIPHFFNPQGSGKHDSLNGKKLDLRVEALSNCIGSLLQLFNTSFLINIAKRQANLLSQASENQIDIVICTTKDLHLLDQLPISSSNYHHYATTAEPMMLGFECQSVLKDNLGKYDYYCFMEDDLILHDPLFFTKLSWFNSQLGETGLLQPNRYEISSDGPIYKSYIDGDINPSATARFQDISNDSQIVGTILGKQGTFRRPLNPHSGCYFLNSSQMEYWTKQPHFLDKDISFISPLESAATLGIMRTFKVYKPVEDSMNFLEIEHYGKAFLGQIKFRGEPIPTI
jgi:hypothetical protein